MADFLHAQGAEWEAWDFLHDFVTDLGPEQAMRFDRWPELLGSLLAVLVKAEPDQFSGEGDGSILRRLTEHTVDMPQALRVYCSEGE